MFKKPLLCVSVLMPIDSAPGAGSVGQQAVVAHTGQEGLPETMLLPAEWWRIGYVCVQHIPP